MLKQATRSSKQMRNTGSTAILLATLVLATVTGCASGDPRQAAEHQVDDASVTAGVKTAIAAEPALKGSEIQVDTQHGVVQLSGFVSSAEDVATAAAVARTVRGVQSVRNDLRLK
jgi:hyperosmotically inducible protein